MVLYLSDSAVLSPFVSIQLVIVFCLKTVKKKKKLMYVHAYLQRENTYSSIYACKAL